MGVDRSILRIGLLVIGYGNTLRSDDAVGPRVAEALSALKLSGVRTLSCALLTPELADLISRSNCVVFVDASTGPSEKVQLQQLSPADSSQILAHAADPRTLLALARHVFGHAPTGWRLTIPVESMEIGETLSLTAQKGVTDAISAIQMIIGTKR
jgi:hydrogenase maturation protease